LRNYHLSRSLPRDRGVFLGLAVLWVRMEGRRGIFEQSLGGEGVHRLFRRYEEKVKIRLWICDF